MCMKPYKNKGTCIYTHTSTNRFIRSVCVWDLAFWFVWIFNVFSQVSSWWHIQLLMSSKPRWWALTWPSGAAECVTAVKTWASVSVGGERIINGVWLWGCELMWGICFHVAGCCGFWCPYCLMCQTSEEFGECLCLPLLEMCFGGILHPITFAMRSSMRERFHIHVNTASPYNTVLNNCFLL